MKVCSICGEERPLLDFAKNGRDGQPRAYCKRCQRNFHIKATYGIDLETYDVMLYNQGGKCAICGVEQCDTHAHFSIDHDHETGEVRGLLCRACNSALGGFRDDPDILRKAVEYLEGKKGL